MAAEDDNIPPPPDNDSDEDVDGVDEAPPEDEDPEEVPLHTFETWLDGDEHPPISVGAISKSFENSAPDRPTQLKIATQIFKCTTGNDKSKLAALNMSKKPNPFIINIPKTSKMRVVYGLEVAFLDEFDQDNIKHVYALAGDYNERTQRPSQVLLLPQTVFDRKQLVIPNLGTLAEKATTFLPRQWPMFNVGTIPDRQTTTVNIMQIAPVPYYMVADAFHQDIEATKLFARLHAINDDEENKPMIDHALNFLAASMIRYRSNGEQPYIFDAQMWGGFLSDVDVQWGEERTKMCCPDLTPTVAPTQPPQQNENQLTLPTGASLQQILEAYTMGRNLISPNTSYEDDSNLADKESSAEKKYGMSRRGIEKQLHLCGYTDSDVDSLPPYLEECAKKHVTSREKEQIIKELIDSKRIYDEAEVALTPNILTVLRDRNYAGVAERQITYANCTKGLSVFLFHTISEGELSELQDDEAALSKASQTTKIDHMNTRKKPRIPKDCEDLILHLKRFANIILPISNMGSPIGEDTKEVISLLTKWPAHAKTQLGKRHLASIMWTFVDQMRYFFLDPEAKTPNKHRSPQFGRMLQCLQCNEFFSAVNVSRFLLDGDDNNTNKTSAHKRKMDEASMYNSNGRHKDNRSGRPDKDSPVTNDKCFKQHYIIRDRLGKTMDRALKEHVTLSHICLKAGTGPPHTLVPHGVCAQAAIFGKCHVRNCRNKHDHRLSNDEAKTVVDRLKLVEQDPNLIFQG